MKAPVRRILSEQIGPDHRLAAIVHRRAGRTFQCPVPEHTQQGFEQLMDLLKGRSLVLDSGCGKGESTAFLAQRHPDSLVLGVDRSASRLGLVGQEQTRWLGDNALLLRADLVGIWLLLHQKQIRLKAHYLLYPNPYPKSTQLSRRWPAHPVFPLMCKLADYLEVRSNWQPYVEEWALAIQLIGGPDAPVEVWQPDAPCTAFERKYHQDRQKLYRWHSHLIPV